QAEPVPISAGEAVESPLRNAQVVPQEHAVQRPRRRYQCRPIPGENDSLDQRVCRWLLESWRVVASRQIGRLRAKKFSQLVAGRAALTLPIADDVEIEAAKPVLQLCRVDNAQRRLHPDLEQIQEIGLQNPFGTRLVIFELNFERFTGTRVEEASATQY